MAHRLLRSPVMCRVLVAEDDLEMRKLLVETLQKDGHEVHEASDGGHLLAKLAEFFDRGHTMTSIDVIVSDVRMPVCTGIELAERLFEAQWRVPCILMTAFGDDELRQRAQAVGALLLDKPLDMRDLSDAVARAAKR